jgi:diguanylate cyclase (GGDEF)-like protein
MEQNNFLYLKRLERRIAYFRWFVLLVVWPISFHLSDSIVNLDYLFLAFALICLYNTLVTVAVHSTHQRYLPLLRSTLYIDMLLITFVIATQNGLRSDLYFFYFIAISYHGAKGGYKATIHALILSLITYSVAVLGYTPEYYFSWGRFFIRFSGLPLITLAIYEMNKEIRQSHFREQEAMDLACTDPLTNLPNRLNLKKEFEMMIGKYIQSGQPFSIVLFDIDNFKKINDLYGHSFGDRVLQVFSEVLKEYTTAHDFVCRFGGEEFLLLLGHSNLADAYERADQIRQDLASRVIDGHNVTLSGGLVAYHHEVSIIDNIHFADEAMYLAKASGKNKIVIHENRRESA